MPLIPGWLRRVSWQVLALALVSGGIIHILATLVVPHFATASAYNRLAALLPVNRMRVLPPASAESQPLPFVGPDERLAICRYSVTDGPVTVTATLPDRGWMLGLYTPNGDNFYVMPAQELRRSEVSFTLQPPPEKFLGLFSFGRTSDLGGASSIPVPQSEGLVVLRAPLRGRAYQAETEALLQLARCAPRAG